MRKYLREYITKVKNNDVDKEDFYRHIIFFEHERLIHLLVTLFYAFLFLFFIIISILSYIFLIPAFMLMIFLIFYIRHYFFLENNTQYLYKLYDLRVKSTKDDKKR